MAKRDDKIVMVKVGSLVYDFEIYPRQHYGDKLDETRVRNLRYVLRSGTEFCDALILDKKTGCVVDGFHRGHAMEKERGTEALIAVIYKTYKDRAAMLEESGRINNSHGKPMDRQDQVHFALKCEKHGISLAKIAGILSMPEKQLVSFLDQRTALNEEGESMAIKNIVGHMAGETFTGEQEEVHKGLGGSSQVFLVNQIISLLRNGMTNTANSRLMERLGDLQKELGRFFRKSKAS